MSGWKTFFDAILGDLADHVEVQESEQGEINLIIASPDQAAAVQACLQACLSSKQQFRRHLPYRIFSEEGTGEQQTIVPAALPQLPGSLAEVMMLFTSWIGPNAMEESEIASVFRGKPTFDDGLLSSISFNSRNFPIQLRKIQCFLAYFIGVTTEQLKQVWSDEQQTLPYCEEADQLLADLDDDSHGKTVLKVTGALKNCFGIIRTSADDNRFYIDIKRMYQLVFPPVVHEVQQDATSDHTILSMDAAHLSAYVQHQLIREDVLLRVSRHGDNGVQAQPVFFAHHVARMTNPNIHVLIIDNSISMQSSFKSLQQKLSAYVKQIQAIDPAASLKIIAFNSTHTEKYFPHITDCAGEIEQYIEQLEAGGNTALFDTISTGIDWMVETLREDRNIVATLFTDGEDTASKSCTSETMASQLNDLSSTQRDRIQIYPFGFGDYCADTVMQEIASHFGSRYTKLRTVLDFGALIQDLEQRQSSRDLVDFIAQLQSRRVHYRVPVSHQHAPVAANFVFPLTPGESTQVCLNEGREFRVGLRRNATVSAANVTDQLVYLASQLNDPTQSVSRIKREVQAIQAANPQMRPVDSQYAEGLLTTIQEIESQQRDSVSTRALVAANMSHANLGRDYKGARNPGWVTPPSSPPESPATSPRLSGRM